MIVQIQTGRSYLNRLRERVKGIEEISPDNPLYAQGFRFKDNQDRTYKANGTYNIRPVSSKYDLVDACYT